jgi:hypothetical protein
MSVSAQFALPAPLRSSYPVDNLSTDPTRSDSLTMRVGVIQLGGVNWVGHVTCVMQPTRAVCCHRLVLSLGRHPRIGATEVSITDHHTGIRLLLSARAIGHQRSIRRITVILS